VAAVAAAAAASSFGAALLYSATPFADIGPASCTAMNENVALAPYHRVVLTQWPALEDPENGLTTIESLFEWVQIHGYDAVEMSVDDFKKKFFPNSPTHEVVARVRECTQKYGIPSIGALYHVPDGITAEMGKRSHEDGTRFDLVRFDRRSRQCIPCIAHPL
jgi:hypothetical protein